MHATLNYAAITARAEQEMHDYLEMAAAHRATEHLSGELIARGAALGVLSMWEGLVAELGAWHEAVHQADRARLAALVRPDTVPPAKP